MLRSPRPANFGSNKISGAITFSTPMFILRFNSKELKVDFLSYSGFAEKYPNRAGICWEFS